ncbi:MAG TPA: hypothetical protein VKJ47_24750, partial [Candidatus Binatia bacterium]|nr:hypothetical protein [Candidatus Binatia bacterium]
MGDEAPDAAPQPNAAARARGRSLGDFTELTSAERRLIDACRQGEVCDLGASRPETVSADRKIDARLVRFLALGGDRSTPVHEKGVRLQGAWLDGVLDLDNCEPGRPIRLTNCRIEAISADGAQVPALLIESSLLEGGLNASRLVCKGDLLLGRENFSAGDLVCLHGAEIGTLICDGEFAGKPKSTKGAPERMAIDLSGATIHGDLQLATQIKGWVDLHGADVAGNLVCVGGRFDNAGGYALVCDHIKVTGNVFLNDRFHPTS